MKVIQRLAADQMNQTWYHIVRDGCLNVGDFVLNEMKLFALYDKLRS